MGTEAESRGRRHPTEETIRRGSIWLVIAASGYGSLVVLIKGAVAAGLNAETALALRFTVATLAWWIILLVRRQFRWPGIRPAAQAAGIGAFFYATNALAYYQGTARVSGALAAMAIAVVPVVVASLAWLVFRERLSLAGRLALVLAVVGGLLLAGTPDGRTDPAGLLWLGIAVLLYSLYIVFSAPATEGLPPPLATFYVIAGASLLYWIWGGLSGRLDFGFAPQGWVSVIGLALIPTVLAMFAFLVGVGIVHATRAAIIGTLEPVVGVLLSMLFLGDRPGFWQLVGSGLIILAAVWIQRERAQVY